MNKKVKLRNKNTKQLKELSFEHASALVKITDVYESANDDYQIIANELIKRPSIKSGTKSDKSKPGSKGKTIPK